MCLGFTVLSMFKGAHFEGEFWWNRISCSLNSVASQLCGLMSTVEQSLACCFCHFPHPQEVLCLAVGPVRTTPGLHGAVQAPHTVSVTQEHFPRCVHRPRCVTETLALLCVIPSCMF